MAVLNFPLHLALMYKRELAGRGVELDYVAADKKEMY